MCEWNSYFQNIRKLKLQFMKTKNLIIAILSIGIVVLAILYFNKCQETAAYRSISEDLYKRKCIPANEFCSTIKSECGLGIGKDSVYYVRELIERRKSIVNVVYGYQIDLKHIDEMYKAIQNYNADIKSRKGSYKDMIQGLRFYEAKSRRLVDNEYKMEPDLVMIPYLKSCKDIYLVDNKKLTQYGVKMYSHFRPCPRLCGKEPFYIHQ